MTKQSIAIDTGIQQPRRALKLGTRKGIHGTVALYLLFSMLMGEPHLGSWIKGLLRVWCRTRPGLSSARPVSR